VFRGGNEGIDYTWSNQTTGRSCAEDRTGCLTGANQSGWYYVPDDEIDFVTNPDKHCFLEANPLTASGGEVDCAEQPVIDPYFAAVPPMRTYVSGMYQNIRWLKNSILPLGDQR
jgi:hypothetical protein